SMILRRIGFGLGVALSTASVFLTWNVPVLAQEGEVEATDEPADAPPPEAAEPEEAPPPQPPPPPEEPPAEEEEPAAEAPEPATAPVPPTPRAEAPDTTQRGTVVTAIGLEHLPGSAFPATYTRGIKYGSLWKTFHGQQWPYMPEMGGPGM